MSLTQITPAEINSAKVSSLPTRPNAPTAMGGAGLSSAAFRAKLDELAMLAINKINALIALLKASPDAVDGSLIGEIDTGIENGDSTYTLAELIATIGTGVFAQLLQVIEGEETKSLDIILSEKAPLASPALTGTPTATTAGGSDNSNRIATTAWVRTLISSISDIITQIQAGTYGNVPIGGETNEVLAKSSEADHALKWQSLVDYAFGSPTATTQTSGDNTTKVATTAFVKAAIDLLKGDVGGAYDTLQEIQAALEANAGGLTDALTLIASKDNKTVFETLNIGANTLLSHTEYRATVDITSLNLTLPTTPENDFICTLDFTTPSDSDMSYSYVNSPDLYSTGDDCTDGVFIPIRGKHYTWVLWYAGGKYQGIVRRSL